MSRPILSRLRARSEAEDEERLERVTLRMSHDVYEKLLDLQVDLGNSGDRKRSQNWIISRLIELAHEDLKK